MKRVAAIMAGGRGERLWPHSRTRLPKQFLSIGGGGSFLQQTYARLTGMARIDEVIVLTAADTVDLVREQLPALAATHLLGEPLARDTAATAALAAHMAQAVAGGDVVVALVPADHAVFDPDAFRAALDTACDLAEREDCPVLLGIAPTRPETGYGYIRRGPALPDGPVGAHAVDRFVEKPDLQRAATYLNDGQHVWNSGICVCRASLLLGGLSLYHPALGTLLTALAGGNPAQMPHATMHGLLEPLRPLSLDYALLERVERAVVLEAAFAWDDVGSWEALARLHPGDDHGNTRIGSAVLSETERSVVYGAVPGRLVVTHGVRDLVVIDTPDSTLVAARGALADLKRALQAVRADGYHAHLDEACAALAPAPTGSRLVLPGREGELLILGPGERAATDGLVGRRARLLEGDALLERDGGVRPLGAQPLTAADTIASRGGAVVLCLPPSEGPAPAAAPGHVVEKPWGREVWWALGPGYVGKRLEVRAGEALSLQYHRRKHETLYVQSGELLLHLDGEDRRVGAGHVATVAPGCVHRMEAVTDAVLFEVSTPELDDIVRLEDRYGRNTQADATAGRTP